MVKVSVVVPIYNVENYLRKCLDSIKRQTLKDIEVICVDDGSKDRSRDIIEKYVAADSRFRIIAKPNAGYGDSMNRGFDAATGKYVGIVESDDYIEKDMFEVLYKAAEKNMCQVVKSDFYKFRTESKGHPDYMQTPTDSKYYNQVINHKTVPEIFNFKMNTWTGIYLREFIVKNGIRHNVTPGASYQDNGFWFQTIALADRIMFVDRAFYHYRQDNPNSSINSKGKVFCMCDEYAYIENLPQIREHMDSEIYRGLISKKYFNYMYTYNRIAEEYKIDFLKRFADDFRDIALTGKLEETISDRNICRIIHRIVKDPVQFYYDDTIWVLQHRIYEIQIRLSNYTKGRRA